MWKISQGYMPSPISSIFTPNLHNLHHFVQPRLKNCSDKVLLEYSCVKAWTSVPETLKQTTHLKTFCDKYKEHLLNSI